MYASKTDVDILKVIRKYVPIRAIGSTKWGGPCPFCSFGQLVGTDRFSVKPDMHLWNCNQCSNGKWHDIITFIELAEGLSYVDACEFLDIQPNRDEVRFEYDAKKLHIVSPPIEWIYNAWKLIKSCQKELYSGSKAGDGALKYLREQRGLNDATIERFHLGILSRSTPLGGGFSGEDGFTVQRGIIMPQVAIDGTLWGVKVAISAKDREARGTKEKYEMVKGSRNVLMGQCTDKPLLIAVEGEFDMFLALQEVGDQVDIVTLGSCSNKIPMRWLKYVNYHPHIALLYDNDATGKAGQIKSWGFLNGRILYPCPTLPRGKDVTEFVVEHKLSFRSWVENILLKSIRKKDDYVYTPEEELEEEVPQPIEYSGMDILKDSILETLKASEEGMRYKELVALFGNTPELEEAFRQVKVEGYIVDFKRVYKYQPLKIKHVSLKLDIPTVPEMPYHYCPNCDKNNWVSQGEEWKCAECGTPYDNQPIEWGVSEKTLKQRRRPVFGQPPVK